MKQPPAQAPGVWGLSVSTFARNAQISAAQRLKLGRFPPSIQLPCFGFAAFGFVGPHRRGTSFVFFLHKSTMALNNSAPDRRVLPQIKMVHVQGPSDRSEISTNWSAQRFKLTKSLSGHSLLLCVPSLSNRMCFFNPRSPCGRDILTAPPYNARKFRGGASQ